MAAGDEFLWLEFVGPFGACGLCGGSGVIDTRNRLRTPVGAPCGVLAWCICPNGRTAKREGGDLEKLAERSRWQRA